MRDGRVGPSEASTPKGWNRHRGLRARLEALPSVRGYHGPGRLPCRVQAQGLVVTADLGAHAWRLAPETRQEASRLFRQTGTGGRCAGAELAFQCQSGHGSRCGVAGGKV